jgi:hypothetical protein
MYCGVSDQGFVRGVVLSRRLRDQCRLEMDKLVASYEPVCDSSLYSLNFIEVVEPRLLSKPVSDLYVVVLRVKSGWSHAPVFANSKGIHWRKYDASIRPMKLTEIVDRCKRYGAEFKGKNFVTI